MKILSLNTHSWIETEPLEKLKQIGDFIIEQKIDKIALQEVNQLMSAKEIRDLSYFCPNQNKDKIREDNFALLLVEYLRGKGVNYFWSWTCSHIGYDIYEEGSAILSKTSFEAKSILVSPTHDKADYHTRQILLADFEKEDLQLASCHFSWWTGEKESGFYYEWQKLLKEIANVKDQVLLLGDFNAPAHLKNEGYELVKEDFYDVYELAKVKVGSYTVDEEIDGWQDNQEKLRIDFCFISKEKEIKSYHVVFNGKTGPVVSDHFGIMIDM
ncbi:endonuclease/exonuclease/phosphatase family protein [Vagococcus fluvialis]|uniref:endonuclease/exonuclease/phosphatase family protein n=1 Tax=Vagococcus fluvialis TaxID=2738 RepID=UPI003D13AF8F